MRCALVAVAVLAGCDRRAPIETCDHQLTGEYAGEHGAWMILDQGQRLEAYPLFPDVPAARGEATEVAPRMIELARSAEGGLEGDARRRYMKGATSCLAKVPVRIARCANDTLEVVHGDTAPPLGFAPCAWGRTEPARVERWTRR